MTGLDWDQGDHPTTDSPGGDNYDRFPGGFNKISLSILNIEFPTRHPKTDCSFVRCLHTELCSNIDPRTEMSIYPDKDNKSSKLR